MLMPQAAIAQSAGTASLPTLSAQVELGKSDDFRQTLSSIVRVMLLLALPATIGLALLRVPLVRVLYERGSFDATSTQMVAWALLWYALGLTGHSLVEVLSRAFYAMHDTKTPVLVGVVAMTGNILHPHVGDHQRQHDEQHNPIRPKIPAQAAQGGAQALGLQRLLLE